MDRESGQKIELIPMDRIVVVNPRVRNKRIFKEIVSNIAELGLKRPVTVAKRNSADGPHYDLVCGQGRLEAYRILGQQEIPALVVDADGEDCMVMSLVENLARRQHRAIDLLHDIQGLKDRGYSDDQIAAKIDLSVEYVRGVIRLLTKGEHRLLTAVESRQIPVSIAVEIATSDDAGIQNALQQAYEKNILRGSKFLVAKRLVEMRRRRGKGYRSGGARREQPMSSNSLLRTYREGVDRKRLLIRKANATKDKLIFVMEALRKLLADENFVTLMRAEGLESLPRNLAERIRAWGEA
ncbi:MAG: ParB N-terminal domain-containing protein [Pseudorhodoplanes sp.]|nr:ParB N-terminal domain-containing protein [Pseudorhodoplanes sp.]